MLNDSDLAWLKEVEARCYQRGFCGSILGKRQIDDALIRTDIPRLIAMVRAGEVHAEWVMKLYDIDGEWHTARVCSNCEQNRVAGIGLAMYCPNCGAKMDDQLAGEGEHAKD